LRRTGAISVYQNKRLNKASISYIKLLPKSPDLNPIEQVWPLVNDAFNDKKVSYRKLSDHRARLFDFVCKILYSDAMASHCKKLYSTMALRVADVIANKGWWSRF
jgi:transposase